jgi:hypothetical protein
MRRRGSPGLCEVGGGQLPLIRIDRIRIKEVLLKEAFGINNLSYASIPRPSKRGSKSLLSGSPYFSTLFYYLGDSDALAISREFPPGPSRVPPRGHSPGSFTTRAKPKEGSGTFSSPFFPEERLEEPAAPRAFSAGPTASPWTSRNLGASIPVFSRSSKAYPKPNFPLRPWAATCSWVCRKKIQEEIQAAIQEKRQDGFPDQFFRKTEPSNKQWGMHYLSDRTIALALFAAEEDIWRDLRYHVSPRRMERYWTKRL